MFILVVLHIGQHFGHNCSMTLLWHGTFYVWKISGTDGQFMIKISCITIVQVCRWRQEHNRCNALISWFLKEYLPIQLKNGLLMQDGFTSPLHALMVVNGQHVRPWFSQGRLVAVKLEESWAPATMEVQVHLWWKENGLKCSTSLVTRII